MGRQAPRHSGIARSAGPDSPRHRPAHTGHLQCNPPQRLDPFHAATPGPAQSYDPCPPLRDRDAAAKSLGAAPDGLGAFRDPHFNREIAESLQPVGKVSGTKTPFVTLITDLADYPPISGSSGSRSTSSPGRIALDNRPWPSVFQQIMFSRHRE